MLRKRTVVTATVLGLASLAAGVAYAAIPDTGGVIRACYKTGGLLQERGALRVTDDGSCRATEIALSWNQSGQPGPVGPAGPAGPAGQRGPSDAWVGAGAARLEGDTATTVASVDLPAGSYTLFGKVELINLDPVPRDGQCGLSTGPNQTTDLNAVRLGPSAGPARQLSVSLQDAITLSGPQTVTLWCASPNGYADRAKLTAVQVATIHGPPTSTPTPTPTSPTTPPN